MDCNDNDLIENFLAGDDSAFSELVKKYLKPVYNFLYHFVTDREALDDITQETFIKAWKNIGKFDQEKKFKTWIFTIAKNTAYDWLKKKKTIPFSNFTDEEGNNKLDNIGDESILSDELLIRADSAKILEEKLKVLPDIYRIILIMHYKEDFSLQEIAKILGKPYNTIKSQHQRGLKILKDTFF
ncbi:MAG TPA: RNA polymerase sigma factor [Candidatus Moranbacteria bacterium]|nr:RNA polymerase sigma factor [Candidatus Moranbacteria bacterium]